MSDLGALLREGREARGLTLAQVEDDTHIRRAYLEALEEGRRNELPDKVFARGLVSTYGRYLGLDREEVRRLYDREFGLAVTPIVPDSHQPISVPLRLPARGQAITLILGTLALVVALATWWYWPVVEPWGQWLVRTVESALGGPGPAPLAEATLAVEGSNDTAGPAIPAVEATATALPTPVSEALPLPTPAPTATHTPPPAPPTVTPAPQSGIRLVARTTGAAWLRVVADGAVLYEGTMQEGQAAEWEAREQLLLRTGNAGGTIVVVNGQDLGPMGPAGEIVERVWLWGDDGLVEATPEP